jgi:hypothetical protein
MDDGRCFYCGSDTPFEVFGVFEAAREIDAQFCCEGQAEDFSSYLETLTDEEWKKGWREFFRRWDKEHGGILRRSGIKVRDVSRHGFRLDYQPLTSFNLVPLDKRGDQKMARQFILEHHTHNPIAPPGWLFGIGCYNDGGFLIAVAWCGRPEARGLDDGKTFEVNRLCARRDVHTDERLNSSSMLYAAAIREAERRGYYKAVTYTLADHEEGTSLKAAGWKKKHRTKDGKTWNCASRPRVQKAPTCAKDRWEIVLDPLRHRHNRERERRRAASLVALIRLVDFGALNYALTPTPTAATGRQAALF